MMNTKTVAVVGTHHAFRDYFEDEAARFLALWPDARIRRTNGDQEMSSPQAGERIRYLRVTRGGYQLRGCPGPVTLVTLHDAFDVMTSARYREIEALVQICNLTVPR